MNSLPSSSWRVPVLVTLLTLLVFGLLVGGITWRLRNGLREEMLHREAELMHAVAIMQLSSAETRLTDVGVDDPRQDLFAAILESSRLRGVLAVRLFDRKGALQDSLPFVEDRPQDNAWWTEQTHLGVPVARFHARAPLEHVFGLARSPGTERGDVPLLEVAVPLATPSAPAVLLGAAHYWLDGALVAEEFARTDRRLVWQASIAFAAGAFVVVLVLAWAFSRLEKTNRQLAAQGADLARANQELLFAAKTAAIGAISSHLIHEIKNPLIGLEGFVRYQAPSLKDPATAETWREAAEATRRLRDMINQVVAILRDEAYGGMDYRMSVREVGQTVQLRLADISARTGVELTQELPDHVEVGSRAANLTCLVLVNLIGNAMEAAPRGSVVKLHASHVDNEVEFAVVDQGPGLPSTVLESLFRPVTSGKPGGSGIGLAISHQLAQQAGGRLDLVRSDATGTHFRLVIPTEAGA